ncbi:MAG: hypothetical protein Fur0043_01000 [Anaerolineales bacterium]
MALINKINTLNIPRCETRGRLAVLTGVAICLAWGTGCETGSRGGAPEVP